MTTDRKSYRPGSWLLYGAALGGFIGLLVDKFAIGLIAGFFVGILVDSSKRRAMQGPDPGDAGDRREN